MKPPVPIPPRLSRLTIVCIVLFVFLTALHVFGMSRVHLVEYRWQRTLPSSAESVPSEHGLSFSLFKTTFALALRSLKLSSHSGVLTCGYSEYISYGSDSLKLSQQWSDHQGWAARQINDVTPANPFVMSSQSVDGGVQIGGIGVITTSRQGETGTALRIPIAYLLILLLIPPLLAWSRRRRFVHRLNAGQCLRCSYTLDGVPTCPECGTAAPLPVSATVTG